MAHLYSTKVTAIGGRHGSIKSDDGVLEVSLAMPKSIGGPGGKTNPEQLFAGGYSACFENAVLLVSRQAGAHLKDDDVEVTAEIGLDKNTSGGFVLSAALSVKMRGVDQAKAEDIVRRAHAVCPYSNAIKGNVDVQFSIFAS